jgi:cytochrome c551/c552
LNKSVAAKGVRSTINKSNASTTKLSAARTTAASKVPAYGEIKTLLQKNTCLACHNPNTRLVGPSYKEVAKRKYSVGQIVQLIHNPRPEHWPGYPIMPPMPQVPNSEARKIAEWIKSLEKAK